MAEKIDISFGAEGSPYRLRRKRAVAAWIAAVVEAEGLCVAGITFIFCSPEAHIEINRRYLGHDYHTDVITFDYSDLEQGAVSGDIFIDPREVGLNARRWGATARGEMLRVLVHGVLHLCGYGDKTPDEQKVMREKEDRCLAMFRE